MCYKAYIKKIKHTPHTKHHTQHTTHHTPHTTHHTPHTTHYTPHKTQNTHKLQYKTHTTHSNINRFYVANTWTAVSIAGNNVHIWSRTFLATISRPWVITISILAFLTSSAWLVARLEWFPFAPASINCQKIIKRCR